MVTTSLSRVLLGLTATTSSPSAQRGHIQRGRGTGCMSAAAAAAVQPQQQQQQQPPTGLHARRAPRPEWGDMSKGFD
jgi:hypothetical protein